mmetsp:Transcript_8331/g.11249  ORF Transcript_8331/g.11249 Transcript_8331/m.11249 type:complete len:106 (+) Transcript_8331:287-604(+)
MILHVRWGGYLQIRQVLTQRFPELQVDGSNYPPPPNKVLVAQLTQAGMFGTIGFTLLGNKDQIWSAVNLKCHSCSPLVQLHLMVSDHFTSRSKLPESSAQTLEAE